MAIDRALNFIIPVETDEGEVLVRSTPVSAAFFKRHFLTIAKTFARMHSEGLGVTTAPRIAAMMLETVERELAGVPDDAPAPPSPIMAEIRRLTSAQLPGGKGTLPWDQVVSAKLLVEDDIGEVENAIVFFTVASAMYHRRDREEMLSGAARLWNARLESSGGMASPPSSPTSSANANSGVKAIPSSIPS